MEIDEKNGSIRIVQEFLFDVHTIPVIERVKEHLEDVIEYIDDEDDVNNIKKFLNTTKFTPEQVASCLHKIADYYEWANNSFTSHSIFEENIIEGGVRDWIKMEFNVSRYF